MHGRALVLGGGGITGVAWEIGLLHGLAEGGIDVAGADLVLGTSAGSIVGANLATGQPVDALYAGQLAPPAGPAASAATRMGKRGVGRLIWATVTSRDPGRARARIGKLALAATTEPEAQRRQVIARRLPVHEWPDRVLRVTAVDTETGELAVFDAASGASLVDAVAASCAVPGVWPPVTIGDCRFMDGGIRSPANADLAAGYERVLILAPIGRGLGSGSGVRGQASALSEAGAQVAVIGPDPAALRAIGRNVLDPARRAPAAQAGYEQAATVAEQVAAVWLAPGRPAPAPGAVAAGD
jgi:NTE family protein